MSITEAAIFKRKISLTSPIREAEIEVDLSSFITEKERETFFLKMPQQLNVNKNSPNQSAEVLFKVIILTQATNEG